LVKAQTHIIVILKDQIKNIKGSKCKLLKKQKTNHRGLMIIQRGYINFKRRIEFFLLKKLIFRKMNYSEYTRQP
jgi:hypothetical protein